MNPYTRFIQELPGVVQTAGMGQGFRDAEILQTRRWKPAQGTWLRVAQLLDLKWLVWYKFLQNTPKAGLLSECLQNSVLRDKKLP